MTRAPYQEFDFHQLKRQKVHQQVCVRYKDYVAHHSVLPCLHQREWNAIVSALLTSFPKLRSEDMAVDNVQVIASNIRNSVNLFESLSKI